MKKYHSQKEKAKKEVRTLSNSSSGDTKPSGINSQDDTKLQIERSVSLSVENHLFPSDLKWEHNTTEEAKAIAGTYARYGYENLVDVHNKAIDRAIELGKKQALSEFKRLYNKCVKIPLKEGKCKCCCNWIDEALNFKKELNQLEKTNG